MSAKRQLTASHVLVTVILTVEVSVTQPRLVDTLVNHGTRELIAAAMMTRRHRVITADLV